jgi:DNA-binding LytR/AlgR family response regulator
MNKIRCLLVDDEPLALDVLRNYIEATPMLEIKGECSHAMEAMETLQHEMIDLMFLDVNLPRLSGIDFLKALPQPPKVIITSAHKDFAVDGFEIGIVDYLLKPFSLDRFVRAVYRAIQYDENNSQKENKTTSNERFIYVRADRKMIKIVLDEVLYIESLGDYARIFLTTGQVITKQKISSLEAMLPVNLFLRIHRSFIANTGKISSFNNTSVFIGKAELPVGPLFKNSAMSKINERSRGSFG